jgi:hypothetical protein
MQIEFDEKESSFFKLEQLSSEKFLNGFYCSVAGDRHHFAVTDTGA